MSPLRVEVYRSDLSRWVQVGEVGPQEPPGTMSSNLPDGTREIYQFSCAKDDSHSVIRKLPLGIDFEIGHFRLFDAAELARAEIVATLKRGDSPYRITVKTDVSPQRRIIRFTHR